MALRTEQEPGDCVGFRRVRLRDDLAHNRRAIVELPRRPAEMSTLLSPVLIEQARLRRCERPLKAVVLGLAGIDLHAVSDHLEQQRAALRRRYRWFVGDNRKPGAD